MYPITRPMWTSLLIFAQHHISLLYRPIGKNASLLQKSFAIEKNLFPKIYTVFLKNLCGFPVFYKVFSKNRKKMFLKIINFYNGFIKKLYGFPIFYKVFSKNRIKMFFKLLWIFIMIFSKILFGISTF